MSITAFLGYHYMDIRRFDKTGNEEVIPITQAFIHDDFDPTSMVSNTLASSISKGCN